MKAYLLLAITCCTYLCKGQGLRTERIDSLLQQYQSLGWNGVVYVGNKDEVQYKKAFGYARVEQRESMQAETLFKTESVGKMFTTTRILQLAAKGKLRLDATLKELLPDWNIPHADSITIEHMLTHTSGLSSPWESPDFSFAKIYTKEEFKKIIETAPVIFNTPGKGRYYSNSAFMLLAEIIAKIDNQPFEASIKQYVFDPAGMTHTGSLNDSILPLNAAQPYYQITSTDFVKDDTKYGDGKASGAGGWMSTAGDLFKFVQAYLNGKLLPAEWMGKQITNNGKVADTSAQWRFGMMRLSSNQKEVILGHNGGGRGFSVDVFFDLYSPRIVVFCSNQWGTGYGLTGRIFDILAGRPYTSPAHNNEIKLCSLLTTEGAERFSQSPDSVMKQLQIIPSERFLVNVSENLGLLSRHELAKEVLSVGRQKYPAHIYTWIRSGDNAVARKASTEAKMFYETALNLARQNKNQALEDEITIKMKPLL